MIKFKDHISLKHDEYEKMINHIANLAMQSKNERMIVHCAKLYMDLATTTVSSGDGKTLVYDNDYNYCNEASKLLIHAKELRIERKKSK